MPADSRLQMLFEKYMDSTCSKEEWEELLQLVREQTNEDNLSQAFQSYWNRLDTTSTNTDYWNEKFTQILNQANSITANQDTANGHTKTRFRIRPIYRWVAAACILLIVGALLFQHYVGVPANNRVNQTATTHDVPAPANTRAVITLANGSKVYLDSVGNGTIAQENNINVVKGANGEIQYQSSSGGPNSQQLSANSLSYNTLFNPRGSKVISLTLSDGTRVWLNSESSLRYPASFAPSALNREVEITGEAYFEVKHNSKQPFKVHLPNGSTVEDIGTSFNINAYPDEDAIKTTLVDGSVKISAPSASSSAPSAFKLRPGLQAIINPANPKITLIEVQTDDVIAWKNNMFLLDNTDLPTIMRQVSRWYDVDVVYEGKVPDTKFVGGVSKNLPLSKVLDLLKSNGIETRVEGKKVIVK